MKKWVENGFTRGEHSVWGYALGKSQELIKFLNDYCQITPVVNPSISLVNKVYEKHGVKLNYVDSQEDQTALSKQFVAVLPMHQVNYGLKQLLNPSTREKPLLQSPRGGGNPFSQGGRVLCIKRPLRL